MDIKEFLIEEDTRILDAMEQLNQVAKKVLFVIKSDKLVAALTDGDIRRWILKKGSLEATVRDVANYSPKFLYEYDKSKYKSYLSKNSIEALPIVNQNMEIISILFKNNQEIETKIDIDIPVVIMAGGLGTRLYPYTKILPKPLIPVGEIPITEHIINRFYKFGIKEYFLILNHKKNMIKAYFNEIERDYVINYVDENIPLGTGGGLSLLKNIVKSTFILSNCDILIEADYLKIIEFHKKEGNLITMVCSLKNIRIPYGVIEISDSGEIEKMKEKPELSMFVNTGMYIVDRRIIDELEINKSIGFPEIIEKYKRQGEKVGIYPISESSWLDMGQLDELEVMRRRLEKDE